MEENQMLKTILNDLNFPEGPAFDSNGDLWFVEIHGGTVGRLKKNFELKRFKIEGGRPNGLAVDSRDKIWFCDSGNNRISVLDPDTGDVKTVADSVGGETLNQPNDLAFDSAGNVVFTCPGSSRKEPTGYVCAITSKGVKKIADGKYFPNGLAFSADGKTLYIAETYRHRIWKGDWNAEKAEWTNAAPWAEVGGPIGPDGMAFGNDGNLYVAVYASRHIKAVSPEGLVVKMYELGGNNPTNCAFAPEGGLVVTEAEMGRLHYIDNKVHGVRLFKK